MAENLLIYFILPFGKGGRSIRRIKRNPLEIGAAVVNGNKKIIALE
jgi:hypothetical protein